MKKKMLLGVMALASHWQHHVEYMLRIQMQHLQLQKDLRQRAQLKYQSMKLRIMQKILFIPRKMRD